MPENNLSDGEKAFVGCFIVLMIVAGVASLATLGVGLYLAVHNWGH